MPLLSVVTPVYNAKPFLAKAVASLRNQPFDDWELILVDNGSTDGSAELCQTLAAEDGRIRVRAEAQNLGPGPARNLGLDAAQGRYVLFLDADDAFAEGVLGDLVRMADAGPDLVYLPSCESLDPFDPAAPRTPCKPPVEAGLSGPLEGFFQALVESDRTGFMVWMFQFRRDFLEAHKLRFHPYRMGEDIEFTLRALCLAQRFSVFDRTFYLWRQSLSRSFIAAYAPHGWAFMEATVSMLRFLHSAELNEQRRALVQRQATGYLEHFEKRFIAGLSPAELEARLPLAEELDRLATQAELPRTGLLEAITQPGVHHGLLAYREAAIARDLSCVKGKEDRDIYLFPAIKKLSWLAWACTRNGIPITGLLDNDPAKIGLMMDGYVIFNPRILRWGYDDPDRLWVIVSTSRRSTGRIIAAQLEAYGLKEGEHFVCTGHDVE